jgi:uncharacterized protein DUF3987
MSSSNSTNTRSTDQARARRLALAAYFATGRTVVDAGWPELDASLIESRGAPVPAFPLHVLPPPWRDWVADTARSIGAPSDYLAQAVMGAVAGLCGAGVRVRITPSWSEPLVLWQALVGAPSSGKSSALASVQALLIRLENEFAEKETAASSPMMIADSALDAVAKAVAANPRGVVLWRDEPTAWLADLAGTPWSQAWAAAPLAVAHPKSPLQLARFAVSILATMRRDSMAEIFEEADDGLLARFLYSSPDLPAWCPLPERKPAQDDQALGMLRRIAWKVRTPDDPLELAFDQEGLRAFDGFLAGLHDERRRAEGLEAAWLGKGGGSVARLAGMIELLSWSASPTLPSPGPIGRDQVAPAVALWSEYFRPHAKALLYRAAPTELEERVRRVARWLKHTGRTAVSREDIRRDALAQSVDAGDADRVIYRLVAAGILRQVDGGSSPRGGPRVRRWQVNPQLGGRENG